MHMKSKLLILSLSIGLTVAGCSALDNKQRQLIFQPSERAVSSSQLEGLQERWIELPGNTAADPQRLHALWLDGPGAQAPVLLYLHGARWSVTASTARMRRMQQLGFAVLGIDYRGFGSSQPKILPSEDSANQDALNAWHWLGQHYPNRPRAIYGHSLGGAIAIDLASQVSDAQGVIVEATFTSIRDVTRSYAWGWLPVDPLITQKFDSRAKVAKVGAPLLVVHGSADTLIAPQLGRQLYEAAVEPKQWLLVDGGTHHNTGALGMSAYAQALQPWMAAWQTPGQRLAQP